MFAGKNVCLIYLANFLLNQPTHLDLFRNKQVVYRNTGCSLLPTLHAAKCEDIGKALLASTCANPLSAPKITRIKDYRRENDSDVMVVAIYGDS